MKSATINHTVATGETFSLKNELLVNSTVNVDAKPQNGVDDGTAATLDLRNVTVGKDSTITMHGEVSNHPVLNTSGRVVNDSTIDLLVGAPGVGSRTGITRAELNIGGSFVNRGQIIGHSAPNSFEFLTISGGHFQNDGLMQSWNTTIDTNVLGHGTIAFLPPQNTAAVGFTTGAVEFGGAVGKGQTIDLTNAATVTLDDVGDFHGTIKNFSGVEHPPGANPFNTVQDMLNIKGVNVSDVAFNGNSHGGVLTLQDDGNVVGRIALTGGDYRNDTFNVARFTTDAGAISRITLA